MAVIANKNTRQNPITQGRTGTQVVKFVPAPRVYIGTAESITAAPVETHFSKSNGVTPSGGAITWFDLGIIESVATVTYTKEIKEIKTGIDLVLRQSYVGEKTANIEFNLSQFDDYAFEKVSGLSASTIISGSTVSYTVGSEDIVTSALLLVLQNKLDGKEIQLYTPSADLTFNFQQNGEFIELQAQGRLKAFTPNGSATEGFFQMTFFA
jgi:hypothetical protein